MHLHEFDVSFNFPDAKVWGLLSKTCSVAQQPGGGTSQKPTSVFLCRIYSLFIVFFFFFGFDLSLYI